MNIAPEHEENVKILMFWKQEQVENLRIVMFWWPEQVDDPSVTLTRSLFATRRRDFQVGFMFWPPEHRNFEIFHLFWPPDLR